VAHFSKEQKEILPLTAKLETPRRRNPKVKNQMKDATKVEHKRVAQNTRI